MLGYSLQAPQHATALNIMHRLAHHGRPQTWSQTLRHKCCSVTSAAAPHMFSIICLHAESRAMHDRFKAIALAQAQVDGHATNPEAK